MCEDTRWVVEVGKGKYMPASKYKPLVASRDTESPTDSLSDATKQEEGNDEGIDSVVAALKADLAEAKADLAKVKEFSRQNPVIKCPNCNKDLKALIIATSAIAAGAGFSGWAIENIQEQGDHCQYGAMVCAFLCIVVVLFALGYFLKPKGRWNMDRSAIGTMVCITLSLFTCAAGLITTIPDPDVEVETATVELLIGIAAGLFLVGLCFLARHLSLRGMDGCQAFIGVAGVAAVAGASAMFMHQLEDSVMGGWDANRPGAEQVNSDLFPGIETHIVLLFAAAIGFGLGFIWYMIMGTLEPNWLEFAGLFLLICSGAAFTFGLTEMGRHATENVGEYVDQTVDIAADDVSNFMVSEYAFGFWAGLLCLVLGLALTIFAKWKTIYKPEI